MSKSLGKLYPLLLFLIIINSAVAQKARPKIGLTLSGGGARGIAHVGLLKAIDSAGLKVDYVTGTSMGSVVGGLYAVGYSGDEILQIAEKLDWVSLLSNDLPLNKINLKEKEDFGKYIELPLNKGKIALKRGFIESNELWLTLAELYYPYYKITDFSNFDKGFQCIATDVTTGKIVVLKKGNIVNAIRASMAIPSVFTPVEIEGRVLVDGGIVRNFPVSNVRAMGAGIVIGSDVSGELDLVNQAQTPIDIMSRLPFYNAVADLENQKKQVDVYVDYPLDKYSTGSFSSAGQILDIGLEKGKLMYPVFKRLKDSLDLIYGKQDIEKRIPVKDSVFITGYDVRGIPASEIQAFIKLVGFKPNSYYTARQMGEAVRFAFTARTFSKINYSLIPEKDGNARVLFDIEKLPSTAARFGMHYNTTTGIALNVGLIKKGFLTPYSTAAFTFSIGENPRAKAIFMDYITTDRKVIIQAEANAETVNIATYDPTFSTTGLYKQNSQNADFQLLWQPVNNWTFGFGTTVSNVVYKPKITSQLQAEGKVNFFNSYVVLHHNTFNTPLYPNRGSHVYIKGGLIYYQHPDFTIYEQETIIATDEDPVFSSRPYTQLKIALEHYIPVNKNAVFLKLQSGMNFNYKQVFINDFVIGGLNDVIRNQVTFAGLPEASVFSSSAVSVQLGYQQSVAKNLFLIAKANGLYYNFIKSNFGYSTPLYGIGCALTAGYKTLLGPVEASLMYSDLNKKILPYFNIGYIIALQ